ncbi:DUF559 domain-containing protein, partial [Acinetobacter baumannii]
GPYVLDFFCPAAQLCVEVDGPMHNPDRDALRDEALLKMGVETIRLPSADLFEATQIEGVRWVKTIVKRCEERMG